MKKEPKAKKIYTAFSQQASATSSVSILTTSGSMTGGNSIPPLYLS